MTECNRQTEARREVEELVARLHRLLDGQLAAGRAGDFSRLEQLGRQADAVMAQIAGCGGHAADVIESHRCALERSYNELNLMLRAEQADVQGKLKQLRRMKRAVNAYRTDR